MKRGNYIGPIQHLIGHGALLRDATVPGKLLAQFDNRYVRRDTTEEFDFESPTIVALPADALGFGWHVFDAKDFALDEQTVEEYVDPHSMPMRSDRSHLKGGA